MRSESTTSPLETCDSESRRAEGYRSHLSTLMGLQILATGSYVPPDEVTNADLAAQGYDPEWIVQRTGIQARRRLDGALATSDMAYFAAENCLAAADVGPEEVELVVVATMTPDYPTPSTACLLQERLGVRAAAMDVNAACAGFMYALITAAQFVKTGCARTALVVGADTNTRIINPSDPKTYPLFGDAAGAVLLGRGSKEQGFLALTLGAEGEGAELLRIPAGGSRCPVSADDLAEGRNYMMMDGRSVFKWAVRLLADTIRDTLSHSGLTLDDIHLVILHQANVRIIEAAAADLGIERERLFVNLDRYGNTSAGSVPLGLDEAVRAGRVRRGDRVLLCGFGAGLAWGCAVLQY